MKLCYGAHFFQPRKNEHGLEATADTKLFTRAHHLHARGCNFIIVLSAE